MYLVVYSDIKRSVHQRVVHTQAVYVMAHYGILKLVYNYFKEV